MEDKHSAGPAERRYEQQRQTRDLFLDRARRACRLTLPWLVPDSNDPDRHTHTEHYALPWNGIGPEGHNNLASRLLMALFPPTETFFRYTLSEQEKQSWAADAEAAGVSKEDVARQFSEFERGLVAVEQSVLREINASSDRTVFHEALLHLIGPGNVLLYIDESDGLKVFHLNRYVCCRDGMGRPAEAVVCEAFTYDTLPKAVAEALKGRDIGEHDPLREERVNTDDHEEETVKVFTHIEWNYETEKVTWHQEVMGAEIEGSEQTLSLGESAWLPLRMVRIEGCDYGIGYLEARCLADLQTADSLSQAVIEGSLIAAEQKNLVRPGGATLIKDLVKCRNGGYVTGNPDDVKALQSEKARDLQVANEALATVENRLSRAFMLLNPRDSERTTAEEIRSLALQIENGLGAIYSILTVEFQVPYIKRRLYLMNKARKLPPMPEGMVKPVVSVGLAAVGRSNDLEKVIRFSQGLKDLAQIVGPEEIAARINISDHIKRLANGLGIETLDLILPEAEVQRIKQEQQQVAMQQQALSSPMADPQKLATAAQIVQQGPPADTEPQTQETPA
jgi:hypothetical protein